jgi:hypothetical protein
MAALTSLACTPLMECCSEGRELAAAALTLSYDFLSLGGRCSKLQALQVASARVTLGNRATEAVQDLASVFAGSAGGSTGGVAPGWLICCRCTTAASSCGRRVAPSPCWLLALSTAMLRTSFTSATCMVGLQA